MKVDGRPMRTLWPSPQRDALHVIDQRLLPHRLQVVRLDDVAAVHRAIRDMWVRGAPLIGATAAYGLALQMNVATDDEVFRFIATHALFGLGIGYTDAHLLAATKLSPRTRLWTRDRRLSDAAARLGIAYELTH